MMKRIGMIAVACMLLLSLLGCNGSNHYSGERTDLYRVALRHLNLTG